MAGSDVLYTSLLKSIKMLKKRIENMIEDYLWVTKVLIRRTRNIGAGLKDSQRRTYLGFILTLT